MPAEPSSSFHNIDVVILTALVEEKAAVVAALGDAVEVIRSGDDDVHIASVGTLRIMVTSFYGIGNVGASAAAREAIETWCPAFIVLVGIAAGIRGKGKDIGLGDVLIADQVVGFELAKITIDGLQRRYQSFRPDFHLLAAANALTAVDWAPRMTTPRPDGPGVARAHVGAVLSGEKVIADVAGVQEIGQVWPTAVGVEMEGLGVALAAYRGGCGFLLVKGVSDFADANKDDRWRRYAAEVAARFTLAVLSRQQVIPPAGARPRQLPRDASWFTGRSGELDRLLALAQDRSSAVAISAIDGMAGIGKTALVVHAGHRLADHYPDGQLFIDLHGFTAGVAPVTPDEALGRMLRYVGVPGSRIPAGVEERAALWRSLLVGRRMLIILDNAADESQVRPLLPGAAGCLVLVTSRRRLTAMDATSVLSLDALPQAEAVLLFARTADRPELTGEMRQALELVELCGRLPLAIRIAAARLKHHRVWAVDDLVVRLRDLDLRLSALDDGQRSVEATLQLSYRHISPEKQRVYRFLGLHPGPQIDAYAAAALTGGSPQELRRLLDGLVDDNLLAEPLPARYVFHDLVRAHAAGLVAGTESEQQLKAAVDRLLDLYRSAAGMAMDVAYPSERRRRPAVSLTGIPMPDLADRDRAELWLDLELANLLAAAHLAVEQDRPEYAWQISVILDRHLRTRGLYRDAERLHQQALALARHLNNDLGEMNALNGLGHVRRRLGRPDEAGGQYLRALSIARRVGDRVGELVALHGLGAVHWTLGRYEQAAGHYGQALRIALAVGERIGERQALHGLGDVDWMLGRHGRAAGHYRQALRIAQEGGDRLGEQFALTGLGHVHLMLDGPGQAVGRYQQALQVARAIGDRVGEVNALIGFGHVHLVLDHLKQADGLYRRALQIAQTTGDRVGEQMALTGIGTSYWRLGCYDQASGEFGRALRIAQEVGDRIGELCALHGLGDVRRMTGRHREAADCYQKVFDIAGELGSGNWQFEAMQGLGRLHHSTGHHELALVQHGLALKLATDLAQPADQARAHDGLAHAHRALDQHDQARLHWQHAVDVLTGLGCDHTKESQTNAQSIRSHLVDLDQ